MRILAAALTGLIISYQGLSPVLAETTTEAAEAPIAAESAVSEPQDIVENLHVGLLAIMQGGDNMGFDGRHDHIVPIIGETFDLTALAGTAIGLSIWRKWDADQKRGYVEAFREFITTNYASQFKSFAGQSFETLQVEDGPRGTKIVRTHLVRPEDEPVALDYILREKKGQFGIADIFLNGSVSEAARRRAEFSSIYRDEGYDGLIAAINALSEENRSRKDGDITE